ncbi:MAG: acetylornithine transaminase [Candidatus Kapaibacterium sp.]
MTENMSDIQPTVLARESAALFPTYDRLKIGVVRSALGVHIEMESGERYLDMIAGLGVNALGHSHPKIIQAIHTQAGKYLHLSNLYLQEPQVKLAEMMEQLSGCERTFFTNSGTEAVEGALKLARKYFSDPNKTDLVGLTNAFHGRTYGALSVMDKEKYRRGYGPFLPGSSSIPSHDASDIAASVSDATAAVIIEVIQGEGGIIEISQEFIAELVRLRTKHNFLIIADEIQSGIGRTGTFFAYEQVGLVPDIVVCAKGIGGGLPLGAILTTAKIAEAMRGGVHGTTFGGNALACAAGLVVLEELANGLQEHVAEESAWFKGELQIIASEYPKVIKEIRGRGFMLGVDMHASAKPIQQALQARMILTNVTHETVLRLLPPLVIERKELVHFLNALREVLAAI